MAESIGLKTSDPRFWNREDLRTEVDRVFDICHSCRLCFKFCGSFPTLFEMIDGVSERRRTEFLDAHPEVVASADEKRAAAAAAGPREHHGESAEAFGDELPQLSAHAGDLSDGDVDKVVDLCFQCKLCYPNCPYTPPHEYALDFPRLLLRWKAHRVRRQGVPLRAKILRNTALLGEVGSMAPGLTSWATTNPLNRIVMEKVLDVHREKLLPPFHGETFARWWGGRGASHVESAQELREGVTDPLPLKVALFATCLVNYQDPVAGKAAVQVLEHNGVEVVYPAEQMCCGMPLLDGGDVDAIAANVRHNVEVLGDWVSRGYEVVIPSPSCSLVIREEYPQLLPVKAAADLASHSHDLCNYVYRIARDGRLKRDFRRRLGKVKYHVPCHLRVQNTGFRGRDLLKLIAAEVEPIQECSGHDGTWSMQTKNFRDSLRWGRKLFEALAPTAGEGCTAACSDCALAATQIRQGAGVAAVHPIIALAWAYGFDTGAAAEVLARAAAQPETA